MIFEYHSFKSSSCNAVYNYNYSSLTDGVCWIGKAVKASNGKTDCKSIMSRQEVSELSVFVERSKTKDNSNDSSPSSLKSGGEGKDKEDVKEKRSSNVSTPTPGEQTEGIKIG